MKKRFWGDSDLRATTFGAENIQESTNLWTVGREGALGRIERYSMKINTNKFSNSTSSLLNIGRCFEGDVWNDDIMLIG